MDREGIKRLLEERRGGSLSKADLIILDNLTVKEVAKIFDTVQNGGWEEELNKTVNAKITTWHKEEEEKRQKRARRKPRRLNMARIEALLLRLSSGVSQIEREHTFDSVIVSDLVQVFSHDKADPETQQELKNLQTNLRLEELKSKINEEEGIDANKILQYLSVADVRQFWSDKDKGIENSIVTLKECARRNKVEEFKEDAKSIKETLQRRANNTLTDDDKDVLYSCTLADLTALWETLVNNGDECENLQKQIKDIETDVDIAGLKAMLFKRHGGTDSGQEQFNKQLEGVTIGELIKIWETFSPNRRRSGLGLDWDEEVAKLYRLRKRRNDEWEEYLKGNEKQPMKVQTRMPGRLKMKIITKLFQRKLEGKHPLSREEFAVLGQLSVKNLSTIYDSVASQAPDKETYALAHEIKEIQSSLNLQELSTKMNSNNGTHPDEVIPWLNVADIRSIWENIKSGDENWLIKARAAARENCISSLKSDIGALNELFHRVNDNDLSPFAQYVYSGLTVSEMRELWDGIQRQGGCPQLQEYFKEWYNTTQVERIVQLLSENHPQDREVMRQLGSLNAADLYHVWDALQKKEDGAAVVRKCAAERQLFLPLKERVECLVALGAPSLLPEVYPRKLRIGAIISVLERKKAMGADLPPDDRDIIQEMTVSNLQSLFEHITPVMGNDIQSLVDSLNISGIVKSLNIHMDENWHPEDVVPWLSVKHVARFWEERTLLSELEAVRNLQEGGRKNLIHAMKENVSTLRHFCEKQEEESESISTKQARRLLSQCTVADLDELMQGTADNEILEIMKQLKEEERVRTQAMRKALELRQGGWLAPEDAQHFDEIVAKLTIQEITDLWEKRLESKGDWFKQMQEVVEWRRGGNF